MKKEPKIFIEHILESIALIEKYVEPLDQKTFFAEQQSQDSIFRRLEIIGEAVKNLPDDFRKMHPHTPADALNAISRRNRLSTQDRNIWASIQEPFARGLNPPPAPPDPLPCAPTLLPEPFYRLLFPQL